VPLRGAPEHRRGDPERRRGARIGTNTCALRSETPR
jgi:hypothetical protein